MRTHVSITFMRAMQTISTLAVSAIIDHQLANSREREGHVKEAQAAHDRVTKNLRYIKELIADESY